MDHYVISGLQYSPMPRLSLRTLRFEDRCNHLVMCRADSSAQFGINVFLLDRCWFRWTIFMLMTRCILYLCYGYHCSYTHFCDVLAFSIMIWRSYKYVDLDVSILCIDVPTKNWKFLIYTHWFYPPYGEQRQSFPPYFGLLVLVSPLIVSIHPLPSSFVSNSTYYLTYGMEDFFLARTFVGQTSLFILCPGSELPRLCWLNLKQVAFPSIQCMWK